MAEPAKDHRAPITVGGESIGAESYDDVPGFCKSATTAEIAPGPRAHAKGGMWGGEVEDDGEPLR